jgi:hypothetical protein
MDMLSEKEQKNIDLVVVYMLAPNHLTCGFAPRGCQRLFKVQTHPTGVELLFLLQELPTDF